MKSTSEQLKRVFNVHNINCTFYTTTTLRTLLSHAKDPVPLVQRSNIVYKYDCKDCGAVNFGESKRTLAERTKEHIRAVRAAGTRRYETADHCWKYNHDFDWENKKIMDYKANTTTRKIKETIHSLCNNNHINRILCRLPNTWFPALKLKGGSEINTPSNQNEETNNQSQASSLSTPVHKICWPTITLCHPELVVNIFSAISARMCTHFSQAWCLPFPDYTATQFRHCLNKRKVQFSMGIQKIVTEQFR